MAQQFAETAEEKRSAWQRLAFIGAVILALANFYDPLKDLYLRMQNPDLGDESLEVAFEQQKLTEKNLDCLFNASPRDMQLDNNIKVRVVACKSGDVQVTVYPLNAPAKQRWISSQSPVPAKASFLDLFLGKALAAEPNGADPQHSAQTAVQNLCQAWQDAAKKSKIIRVTNEGGKCFKEIVNVFTGRVEYREEVPCNSGCKAS